MKILIHFLLSNIINPQQLLQFRIDQELLVGILIINFDELVMEILTPTFLFFALMKKLVLLILEPLY